MTPIFYLLTKKTWISKTLENRACPPFSVQNPGHTPISHALCISGFTRPAALGDGTQTQLVDEQIHVVRIAALATLTLPPLRGGSSLSRQRERAISGGGDVGGGQDARAPG